MGRMIDVVVERPELFGSLDEHDIESIRATCTSGRLEERAPTLEGAAGLVMNACGEITYEEFIMRAVARTEAQVERSMR